VIVGLIVAALVVAYVARLVVARRGRSEFCNGACVTLALRLKPTPRAGWRHGFARLNGNLVEWRAEHKLGYGADLSFDLNNLHITEHRPVRTGETMLSDLCELVSALYQGERIELGVPRTELATLLGWLDPE
jgi:hypothetical protein